MGKMKDALEKLAKKVTGKEAEDKNSISNVIEFMAENYKDGGTEVEANPELAGDEDDLTALEVNGTKYKVPQGGGGSSDIRINEEYSFEGAVNIETVKRIYSLDADEEHYSNLQSVIVPVGYRMTGLSESLFLAACKAFDVDPEGEFDPSVFDVGADDVVRCSLTLGNLGLSTSYSFGFAIENNGARLFVNQNGLMFPYRNDAYLLGVTNVLDFIDSQDFTDYFSKPVTIARNKIDIAYISASKNQANDTHYLIEGSFDNFIQSSLFSLDHGEESLAHLDEYDLVFRLGDYWGTPTVEVLKGDLRSMWAKVNGGSGDVKALLVESASTAEQEIYITNTIMHTLKYAASTGSDANYKQFDDVDLSFALDLYFNGVGLGTNSSAEWIVHWELGQDPVVSHPGPSPEQLGE